MFSYRYTEEELAAMLGALNARMEAFDHWCKTVSNALASSNDSRLGCYLNSLHIFLRTVQNLFF